ncbi:UNVERIFIED_CONTAM: Retrovirus-related Pol polyprotein from transposon [Sesamum radiatum]|uniref:Retrovirus-related Pol polyprotein from transposon n=1 Tax=Sesamum radiatum TaxID=300843 RepID=A0AAW2TI17_SESRA
MLAPEDRKKVSFITSEGTFCYVAIPFGLKNAGATYQRLVDKILRPQIGRNVEVYFDDMLVKSKKAEECQDLEKTFSVLKQYKLKLNPAKCAFGVQGGRFLGFMVT